MSWLDTIGTFLTDNEKLIKGGLGVFDYLSGSGSRSDYQDVLNRAAKDEWERGRQEYEATKKYNEEYGQWAQANAASRAAAARANHAARIAAAKKAQDYMNKQLTGLSANYKPYNDAALRLLPQMEQAYTQGLGNLGLLSGYLGRPEMQGRIMAAGVPVDIPLPKKMVGA